LHRLFIAPISVWIQLEMQQSCPFDPYSLNRQ
jgi:hypothetical protein